MLSHAQSWLTGRGAMVAVPGRSGTAAPRAGRTCRPRGRRRPARPAPQSTPESAPRTQPSAGTPPADRQAGQLGGGQRAQEQPSWGQRQGEGYGRQGGWGGQAGGGGWLDRESMAREIGGEPLGGF